MERRLWCFPVSNLLTFSIYFLWAPFYGLKWLLSSDSLLQNKLTSTAKITFKIAFTIAKKLAHAVINLIDSVVRRAKTSTII